MKLVKPILKIDWATHEAAKYACENWHYSCRIPVNKLNKLGVWEDNKFLGVVIFGVGASAQIHKQFNLNNYEVCELVRVALREHKSQVSRIIRICLNFLKKNNPKLRVVVSFADNDQGHHGGIYQAGNWIYTGKTSSTKEYFYNGRYRHVTDIYKRVPKDKIKNLPHKKSSFKYRYVMPLDAEMRKQIEPLAKPYPKRVSSADSGTGDIQSSGGGASPTDTLQNSEVLHG